MNQEGAAHIEPSIVDSLEQEQVSHENPVQLSQAEIDDSVEIISNTSKFIMDNKLSSRIHSKQRIKLNEQTLAFK